VKDKISNLQSLQDTVKYEHVAEEKETDKQSIKNKETNTERGKQTKDERKNK
jgi:hypothetical protein